ncbi:MULTISPECIES: hypothetical protein [Sinorhizobium/Ensifer group]|jgi:hypothetical protein|uniref:hypothetical protein n=1 Tax=Sinorhizobium/Ensifer group TaxID=227292 RepID=UPI000708EA66|nr:MULTISPECIES: hypothetical protein [Sinorhizobium/Ensifer group]KRD48845.1 hypothetical protein ASE60_19915 [Ensifer sp. Root278]KSV95229.1 hypothetical protein N184_14035 [Sinorhizobium sp. GL28]MBD9510191.1 hypothetical protein [Ensifer sp. ENS10]MBV7520708.1 hypothetical protein [Ensifer sp. ENS12]SDA52889.1 hypothetical protein SAMN03159448_01162 [Sinorhizobium sp. NFACC03]
MTAKLKGLAGSGVVHVAFAFFAMGGWALFANRHHPMPKPLLAAVIQGTLSALLTLYLKTAVDALSRRFRGTKRLFLPPLLACLGSSAALVAIHTMSGTPEVLRTIALPLAVSTTYAAIYNYSINRGEPGHDR